jgi:hypothetical protein
VDFDDVDHNSDDDSLFFDMSILTMCFLACLRMEEKHWCHDKSGLPRGQFI